MVVEKVKKKSILGWRMSFKDKVVFEIIYIGLFNR